MLKHPIHKKYLDIHTQKIKAFGMTEMALWNSKESQIKRFKIIEKVFLTNSQFSILDYGCGLCHFYDYLIQHNYYKINYTGLDINEEFINEAKKRNNDLNIVKGSLNSIPNKQNFDYIIASGIYNLGDSLEKTTEFFLEQIIQLFKMANIGLAINFLSNQAIKQDPNSIYHNPNTIINICFEKLSKHIVLYHHYLPNDFTVLIYKDYIQQ